MDNGSRKDKYSRWYVFFLVVLYVPFVILHTFFQDYSSKNRQKWLLNWRTRVTYLYFQSRKLYHLNWKMNMKDQQWHAKNIFSPNIGLKSLSCNWPVLSNSSIVIVSEITNQGWNIRFESMLRHYCIECGSNIIPHTAKTKKRKSMRKHINYSCSSLQAIYMYGVICTTVNYAHKLHCMLAEAVNFSHETIQIMDNLS